MFKIVLSLPQHEGNDKQVASVCSNESIREQCCQERTERRR